MRVSKKKQEKLDALPYTNHYLPRILSPRNQGISRLLWFDDPEMCRVLYSQEQREVKLRIFFRDSISDVLYVLVYTQVIYFEEQKHERTGIRSLRACEWPPFPHILSCVFKKTDVRHLLKAEGEV